MLMRTLIKNDTNRCVPYSNPIVCFKILHDVSKTMDWDLELNDSKDFMNSDFGSSASSLEGSPRDVAM